MAARKNPSEKTPNSGRATVRDVLQAVIGLNERIDDVNTRCDRTLAGQQKLSDKLVDLKGCVTKLEDTTNHRLHEMEADITMLKRPWIILASGWSKAVALSGFTTAATATVVKLEAWRFLPF